MAIRFLITHSFPIIVIRLLKICVRKAPLTFKIHKTCFKINKM